VIRKHVFNLTKNKKAVLHTQSHANNSTVTGTSDTP